VGQCVSGKGKKGPRGELAAKGPKKLLFPRGGETPGGADGGKKITINEPTDLDMSAETEMLVIASLEKRELVKTMRRTFPTEVARSHQGRAERGRETFT